MFTISILSGSVYFPQLKRKLGSKDGQRYVKDTSTNLHKPKFSDFFKVTIPVILATHTRDIPYDPSLHRKRYADASQGKSVSAGIYIRLENYIILSPHYLTPN